MKKIDSQILPESPELAAELVEFVWRNYVGEHQFISASTYGSYLRKRVLSRFSSRAGSSSRINWLQNKNEDVCRQTAICLASFAEDFESGRWSCFGLGKEEKCDGSLIQKPMGEMELDSGHCVQESLRGATCVQVLVSNSKRRAQKEGWSKTDPPQRRPKFCRNVVENRRISQPSHYVQRSLDLVFVNISQESVTHLTKHETADLVDRASRNRSRSAHSKTVQFEFKSWRHVSSFLENCFSGTLLCNQTSDSFDINGNHNVSGSAQTPSLRRIWQLQQADSRRHRRDLGNTRVLTKVLFRIIDDISHNFQLHGRSFA